MTDQSGTPRAPLAFLLIPGAGLGSWIWRDVLPLLQAPAAAVDFGAERTALTLDNYADAVTRHCEELDAERVILVAHSAGGVVALHAAPRLAGRIAGVAGIAAAFPRAGSSWAASLPFPQRLVVPVLLRLAGTRPPASAIRSGLCSDLPEPLCDEVVRRFVPESRALFVSRHRGALPDVPTLYTQLTEDREFGLALQQRMAHGIRAATVEIASGHLPMLSRPAELAEALNAFAAQLQPR